MTNQHNPEKPIIIDVRLRMLLMAVRQGLILIVTAIEKFLGIEKHKFTHSETE